MSREDNLSKLIKLLRARLRSSGKIKTADINNNEIYLDHDIFSIDVMVSFLELSLSDFNQMPLFTSFTFDDDKFVTQFSSILVEGAVVYALGSQALLERGREFKINDNGVSFDVPNLSEILNTQYSQLLQLHWEKLKHIKFSIKSFLN